MESRTIWGLTTEEWQAGAKTPFPNPLGHGTISQTLMGVPKELGVQKAQVPIQCLPTSGSQCSGEPDRTAGQDKANRLRALAGVCSRGYGCPG